MKKILAYLFVTFFIVLLAKIALLLDQLGIAIILTLVAGVVIIRFVWESKNYA